jgi:flagellar protein FlaI
MFKIKFFNIFSYKKRNTIIRLNDNIHDPILYEYIKPILCNTNFKNIILEYNVKGIINVKIGILQNNEILYCLSEPVFLKNIDINDLINYISIILEVLALEGYEGIPTDMTEFKRLASKYKLDFDFLKEYYVELSYYIKKGLSSYGPLYPLIEDPNIEEIAIEAPGKNVAVIHRLLPVGWINTNITISEEVLDALVLELARRTGREVSLARPYLESLLQEGHRVSATFSREISRFGSSLIIRKHRLEPFTIPQLVKIRMLSPLLAAYLWLLLLYRAALLIIGPTASGKTTLLQALLHLIPPYARIVTIEDTPELNLSFHPHWDSLVARRAYESDEEDIDIYKLALFALRRRPDYFIIGEVRGSEARVFIHAAASGHSALTTFHADSVETALYRLKAPPISIDDSFIQLLWAIVVVKRIIYEGIEARRVVYVDEVIPKARGFELHRVFTWNPQDDTHYPNDVDELIAKSIRLKMLMETYGLKTDDIKKLLNELIEVITSCFTCTQSEFINKIYTFYRNKLFKIINNFTKILYLQNNRG